LNEDDQVSDLNECRHRIDALDLQIVSLLGERFQICRVVAGYKRAHGIPMMQSGRVDQVKERVAAMAEENAIDPQLMREIYTLIIADACRLEDEIIDAP
jgi:chorismate mutase